MLDRDKVKLERTVKEMADATTLYYNISSKRSATEIATSLTGSRGALNALINSTGVAEFENFKRQYCEYCIDFWFMRFHLKRRLWHVKSGRHAARQIASGSIGLI